MCVAAMLAKRVRRIPHAGQDINSSIESYHGEMKKWLGSLLEIVYNLDIEHDIY